MLGNANAWLPSLVVTPVMMAAQVHKPPKVKQTGEFSRKTDGGRDRTRGAAIWATTMLGGVW